MGYGLRNRKKLKVVISDQSGRVLLTRTYSAEAGNLKWAVRWSAEEKVEIMFFEEPGTPQRAGERQIFSVLFERGADGGFVEGSAPVWVSDENERQLERTNARHVIWFKLPWSRPTLDAAHQLVETVAQELELRTRALPDSIHPMVVYEGKDHILEFFQRHPEEFIHIKLEDWDRREVSRSVWNRFSVLPFASRERTTKIVLRPGALPKAKFNATVEEIVSRNGFRSVSNCPAAYSVCYFHAQDVWITHPKVYEPEDELSVVLTDHGWSSVTDATEKELRAAFKRRD
jgi:hypothetical protein